MLSSDQNDLLTRVSADVPMGRLFRQYWHPFAAEAEMRDRWTMRVRLLGEDLVLFKDRQGRLGLSRNIVLIGAHRWPMVYQPMKAFAAAITAG